MEHFNCAGFPIGMYSGSCGKQKMMNRVLYEIQQQNKTIIVVDPQKELVSLMPVLDTDEKDK